MADKINDTIMLEVTGVDKRTYYPKGYSGDAETITTISLTHNKHGQDSALRSADITIPGNLPLGTRFKLTIEQVDEVTPATIHRGALPVIEDHKLIEGGDGGVN